METYVDESTKTYTNIRDNASIDVCFGNKSKEEAWNAVIDFFNVENKNYFRKINQTYKTAFLIHGPSGTGKTELLFQIASYTWSKYQKPVYIINPKGLSDNDLNEVFDKIQSGYILIDEWDLFLVKEGSGKKNGQYPSLNAWLNILDRVSGEIIFWFTSNNYEELAKYNNGALVRPGRIDHIFKFDKMTSDEVKNAWKYFNPNDNNIDNFSDESLNGITIAQIINNLKKKLSIDDLIKNKNNIQSNISENNSENNTEEESDDEDNNQRIRIKMN
jgi:SpoVK/Ycf46/Vps4 family AAA+-type ATPase